MRTLAISLMLAVLSLPTQAEVYKWTDANGKVHYSDKPVGNGAPISMRKPQAADPEAKNRLKQFRNQLEGSRQIRNEKTEEAQQLAAERQAKCVQARNYLKDLEESGPVYEVKDGERIYLDHRQKDQHMAEMRQFLQENCS